MKEEKSTIIFCHNLSAFKLIKNPIHHAKTKYIEIQYHYIRKKVENKEVEVKYIYTTKQQANIFTKFLEKIKF